MKVRVFSEVCYKFIGTQLHIDKAYTAQEGRLNREETLEESIKIMQEIK